MQLKKRYSVRKGVAAGAMAVAMFASSMPAMASNGLGLGLTDREKDSITRNDDRGEDDRDENKSGIGGEIRDVLKAIKLELKLASKDSERSDRSASTTASVATRKQCRKEVQADYAKAMEDARVERDAGLKKARESYLAALKAARDAYHASIGTGATGSASGTVQVSARAARKTYQQAVKKAQADFSDAKHVVSAAYRVDVKTANDIRKTAEKACKQ